MVQPEKVMVIATGEAWIKMYVVVRRIWYTLVIVKQHNISRSILQILKLFLCELDNGRTETIISD